MNHVLAPFFLAASMIAGWLERRQQEIVAYLIEENRTLKQFGKRRLRLNDDQRRRLAVKGEKLGRKLLTEVASIVTLDTILRWHRLLYSASLIIPRIVSICRLTPRYATMLIAKSA